MRWLPSRDKSDLQCYQAQLQWRTCVVLEPADGALGVAGMKKYAQQNNITGQTLVAIYVWGQNMDFDRLPFVSEHANL